jgi:uncharacterized delta-60 repeat protein
MKRVLTALCALAGIILLATKLSAQSPGAVDTSFRPGSAINDVIWDMAAQPDGKPIIAGGFAVAGGLIRHSIARLRIARLKEDGAVDDTFDAGAGLWTPKSYPASVYALAPASDGKLVIAGGFSAVAYTTRHGLARLNPDGKIVLAGRFEQVQGANRRDVGRLLPDGALDPVFDPGPGFELRSDYGPLINALALQPDGRLVAGGWFTSYDGFAADNVVRIFGGDQVRIAPPQILAGTPGNKALG